MLMKNFIVIIILIILALLVYSFAVTLDQNKETLNTSALGTESQGSLPEGLGENEDDPASSPVVGDNPDSVVSNTMVTYTQSGFSPAVLTISKGDTVTFVNENGPALWVASANHPTHTIYPKKSERDCLGSSFDQCEAIEAGNEWSFSFSEIGEWGYHNHLRPSHQGVIVVE